MNQETVSAVGRAMAVVEALLDIRKTIEDFRRLHKDVFEKYEVLKETEAEQFRKLEALKNEIKFDPGVKRIPLGGGFFFTRQSAASYCRPDILEHWKELVAANVIKPPTASSIKKLVEDGRFPTEMLAYIPPKDDDSYTIRLNKPKGWDSKSD